jgi:hypothetical protein
MESGNAGEWLDSMKRDMPDPDIRLVTIFRTSDADVVAVAKSILDDAGIDYVVAGEILLNVMGWSALGGFNSALGEAEFQVREADALDASRLLNRLSSASA